MTYLFTLKPDFIQDQVFTFEDLQELHDSTVALYNSFSVAHNPTTGAHRDRQIAKAIGVAYYHSVIAVGGTGLFTGGVSTPGYWILEFGVACGIVALPGSTASFDPTGARLQTAYSFATSAAAGAVSESQCCVQTSVWPSANLYNAAEDVTQLNPWHIQWYNRQRNTIDFASYYEVSGKWQLSATGCKFSFRIFGK